MPNIKVLLERTSLPLPAYQTEGAAGMDVRSSESVTVGKGETAMVRTGLYMAIPENFEVQVRSRSGMASKGIFVTNSPGTIDSDYRGEIKVLLSNHSTFDFEVRPGDRIAQLVLAPVYRIEFEQVDELPPTVRGNGGYGSTGVV
jgi:dUTP pyrophosphatase